jgi:hypothetical protein
VAPGCIRRYGEPTATVCVPENLNACAMLGRLFGVNEVMEAQASQTLTDLANDYQTLERVSRIASEHPKMMGAFFDDSGTHDGSSVVAMGGLLGTEQHWVPSRSNGTRFSRIHCPAGPHSPSFTFHTAGTERASLQASAGRSETI